MAHWFLGRLADFGAAPALVYPMDGEGEQVASYADVLAAVDVARAELVGRGIGAGSVVAIEGTFTLRATALLLALIDLKAVAVPLTADMRPHRETFLSIAEVDLLAEVNARDEVEFLTLSEATKVNTLLGRLRTEQHPGLVIFSSGTTGTPKAILHDFERILGKFREKRKQKNTLCFLLFDHIGGIDTLLNTFASGGTLVTVGRRDPLTVVDAIEKHRVHTLPTSPTFLNLMLMAGVIEARDLSCLRVIAYGTEPMPAATLSRLAQAFPDVALVQTYGMSELGVLRSRSRSSDSPWLEFSQDGYQVKVVDGVLWVKADAAMLGYLNAPDLFDEDGWLNTQDAVEVDGNYFRILGRKTDLINVGGQKVYPNEVETHLLSMPNVADVAVFGKPHPMTGQMVAARFNLQAPEELSAFKTRMFAHCRERLAPYQIPRHVEIVDAAQFGARFKKQRS
jgi:long-chain acyl-CoA synthetase